MAKRCLRWHIEDYIIGFVGIIFAAACVCAAIIAAVSINTHISQSKIDTERGQAICAIHNSTLPSNCYDKICGCAFDATPATFVRCNSIQTTEHDELIISCKTYLMNYTG